MPTWNSSLYDSLSSIIPAAHQIHLDGTLDVYSQLADIELVLEHMRALRPTVLPQVLPAAQDVASILAKPWGDDLPRPTLSAWGNFCPVKAMSTAKLVPGSPAFGVSFKVRITLSSRVIFSQISAVDIFTRNYCIVKFISLTFQY
jgi:hypothetical protein